MSKAFAIECPGRLATLVLADTARGEETSCDRLPVGALAQHAGMEAVAHRQLDDATAVHPAHEAIAG